MGSRPEKLHRSTVSPGLLFESTHKNYLVLAVIPSTSSKAGPTVCYLITNRNGITSVEWSFNVTAFTLP